MSTVPLLPHAVDAAANVVGRGEMEVEPIVMEENDPELERVCTIFGHWLTGTVPCWIVNFCPPSAATTVTVPPQLFRIVAEVPDPITFMLRGTESVDTSTGTRSVPFAP